MDQAREQQKRAAAVAIGIAAAVCLFVVFGLPRIGRAAGAPSRAGVQGIRVAQGNVAGGAGPSPGAPGMGGPAGMPGAPAAPGAPGAAAGGVGVEEGPPLERSRPNPFMPLEPPTGIEGGLGGYFGPQWGKVPITAKYNFPRPQAGSANPPPSRAHLAELRPGRGVPADVVPPPLPTWRRMTGVVWTPDGSAVAILQRGEEGDVETQVLRPGDVFTGDNTVVERVERYRVILRDRSTGEEIVVPLQSEEDNPPPSPGPPMELLQGGMMGGMYGGYGGYGGYGFGEE
ncbi:MAG: hypothetical protein ACE5R4_07460 [Armatimonadota bacterium]